MLNQDKQYNEKGKSRSLVAAVTIAAVGVGIAVAGAMALKDKKNRKKVKKVLTNAKDQAADYIDDVKNQVQDKTAVAEKKLSEGKESVKEKLKGMKKN